MNTFWDLVNIEEFDKRDYFKEDRWEVSFYCKDCKEIVEVGEYPLVYEDLIGNFYYTALFDKEEDALLFSDYVRKTNVSSYSHGERISHITGEDRRMLDERKQENDSSDLNICDKHIDGA